MIPHRKVTVHYQRKATVLLQSDMRQDTVHHKTETSREQPLTSDGKKKSVTFGDSYTEEEKRPREHGPAPTPLGVTSAAKTKIPIP